MKRSWSLEGKVERKLIRITVMETFIAKSLVIK